MAKRSVEITLLNNTNYYLQEYWEAIPHGSWGGVTGSPAPGAPLPNWSLPSTIAPLSTTTWSSADSEFSIGKGTEAWVKFSLLCGPPLGQANLLYLHWDNPFVWANNDPPGDNPMSGYAVLPGELNFNNPGGGLLPGGIPPQQQAVDWPGNSLTVGGLSSPENPAYAVNPGVPISAAPNITCDIILISNNASGPPTFNFGSSGAGPVFDVAIGWPELVISGLIDLETDVNFSFTFVLRERGSVLQSIRRVYDGSQGLLALAKQQKQQSLRKLFAMP